MTNEEKIKKFEEIQKYLWDQSEYGNIGASTICAAIIRELEIESPTEENPNSA